MNEQDNGQLRPPAQSQGERHARAAGSGKHRRFTVDKENRGKERGCPGSLHQSATSPSSAPR